jgi:hypothetical protein
MALEDLLTKLIASLDANTAAYKAAGAPGASAGGTAKAAGATVKPTAAAAPTVAATAAVGFEEVKVAAGKVMDKHGKPFAKRLIKDVGGATELATVKPEKYGAMMAAFQKALEGGSADAEEDEEL